MLQFILKKSGQKDDPAKIQLAEECLFFPKGIYQKW
jgi:hypothetical protein